MTRPRTRLATQCCWAGTAQRSALSLLGECLGVPGCGRACKLLPLLYLLRSESKASGPATADARVLLC